MVPRRASAPGGNGSPYRSTGGPAAATPAPRASVSSAAVSVRFSGMSGGLREGGIVPGGRRLSTLSPTVRPFPWRPAGRLPFVLTVLLADGAEDVERPGRLVQHDHLVPDVARDAVQVARLQRLLDAA